ncbi:TonB-dependent receptor [Mangrovimonas xylaniphaga]|uniref:TonB-dependent receptor n=1 Tax=Mangrovimonas xylaniphaga TaxID=1645915 RepID=UPI0006B4999C|nr:TonB-dependent receptor plug domain-containing protein [Mangrovimonas xylaniphaga]
MKKLIGVLIMLTVGTNYAQTLQGSITDTNQQPLENVYVYNHTSKIHAHTAMDGRFSLEHTHAGDSITANLLGFKTVATTVTPEAFQEGLNITMESKLLSLDELIITKDIDPMHHISQIDIETSPVNSSQEILRKVPGLFIGQHAGGGKAEQIFLRGFDIDHGTDINLSVDGIPINMVSHAHGQGYSDLHFMIPETLETIDFGKGPYYAERGDFATAGYVAFSTKDDLEQSSINLTYGQFNTVRTLGMFKLTSQESRDQAYMAIEYLATDGPFHSPQNFNRLNALGKYTANLRDGNNISLGVSRFTSRWDASGQIPQRAVDQGIIDRFGAIDDTEGGTTSRSNVNVQYKGILDQDTKLSANVFYSRYTFELYSNFTFFLEDPINGDQIKQAETRDILGFNAQINHNTQWRNMDLKLNGGAGLRYDISNQNELTHTKNRKDVLQRIQLGDINQTQLYAFANAELSLGNFKLVPALRLDYFNFMNVDALADSYATLDETKAILSPKFNVFYTANERLQWFVKSGVGFHSNDARVAVQQEGKEILPKAYGVDVGTIWKPWSKMVVHSALWYLYLQQEFVYVGDAGIVEPSGKTQRYGLDLGLRYQLSDWLYLNSDATFTHALSLDAPNNADYIPLAPSTTLTAGLSINNYKQFSGGINLRYLKDRPANEDNSIVAEGYVVTDASLSYTFGKIQVGLIIENLFNVDWNETQFATESRLFDEAAPVEEIHFTPGIPFFTKGTVSYRF